MGSTSSEEAVKLVEMTTMDLKYYMNLVDQAVVKSERTNSILEEVLLWVKCYQTTSHATKKSLSRKEESFVKH